MNKQTDHHTDKPVVKNGKNHKQLNIGFISTRFAGLDGVSLESTKWAEIMKSFHHNCFWFAGKLDKDPETSMLVPKAFFKHPDNLELNKLIFGTQVRERKTTDIIFKQKEFFKNKIYAFLDKFNIDMIVAENVLAIPMHIPLGLALTEVIAETGIPTIAHHHDFAWERPRFLLNSIQDIIQTAFPPDLPSIRHVVINSVAQTELAAKRGISSTVIYNVLDFEKEPVYFDDFNRDVRTHFKFKKDDILILQPTRVISRKGIEQALYLTERLNLPNLNFLISHTAGDEGEEYYEWIKQTALDHNVNIKFLSNRLHDIRRYTKNGKKLYSLWDIYPHVDLITYPSLYEGFGNAFLEAIYFRKPLLVNRYSVYIVDLEPKGFDVVAIDGFLTNRAVDQVRKVLLDKDRREQMVERNYQIGKKHFSYQVLKRNLRSIFTSFYGYLNGNGNGNGHTDGTNGSLGISEKESLNKFRIA